jgi:hypothetical protein
MRQMGYADGALHLYDDPHAKRSGMLRVKVGRGRFPFDDAQTGVKIDISEYDRGVIYGILFQQRLQVTGLQRVFPPDSEQGRGASGSSGIPIPRSMIHRIRESLAVLVPRKDPEAGGNPKASVSPTYGMNIVIAPSPMPSR